MTTFMASPGDKVLALSAFDELLPRRAVTGPMMGTDFTVVWVCSEAEWAASAAQDRPPIGVPWPVEDVRPA